MNFRNKFKRDEDVNSQNITTFVHNRPEKETVSAKISLKFILWENHFSAFTNLVN